MTELLNNFQVEAKERLKEKSVLLVRHGETTANANGVLVEDPILTGMGERQARETGFKLRSLNNRVLVHTGLRRTLRTAELIKESGGIEGELVKNELLRERKIGKLEGLNFKWLLERYSEIKEAAERHRGSSIWLVEDELMGLEPVESMYKRVIKGISEVVDLSQQPCVVVCHSGTIKMLKAFKEGCKGDRDSLLKYLLGEVPTPGSVKEMNF